MKSYGRVHQHPVRRSIAICSLADRSLMFLMTETDILLGSVGGPSAPTHGSVVRTARGRSASSGCAGGRRRVEPVAGGLPEDAGAD